MQLYINKIIKKTLKKRKNINKSIINKKLKINIRKNIIYNNNKKCIKLIKNV